MRNWGGGKKLAFSESLRWVLKRRKTSFSLDAQRKPGLMSGHYPPPILILCLPGQHNGTNWVPAKVKK
jgi:hypothetical protein